ncbi:ATP-binding protein [Aquabacterium sp.]|uniref:ATP-binding protein n=1 Tax=Aquabacterium sp. TaxID=1872578 RepID=UPI002C61FB32|nr:ATP-binding protein [Aquabacterium sp.]HSW03716.1 ATP-binding protein [Aquabacterium sp.]
MPPPTSTEPPPAAPAAGPISPRLKSKVLAAQASMVFERSRLANLLGLPFSLLICWVLWGQVSTALLLGWLGAKLVVCLWRVAVDLLQRRAGRAEAGRWLRHYQVAHVADGLVYGSVSTWLVPDVGSPLGVLMAATVVGTASVGFVVLSQHYRTMLAFVLPLLLPTVVWQLWAGTEISLFAGIGTAMFVGLMLIDGWRASAHTEATLRLRYRMDELADQRRQAMELAQQHSAVKGRFLATMSHEMRTPLHGMLGMAQQLRGARLSSPQEFEQRIATIEQAGEHLLSLINDVLDFSTIESGQMQAASSSFDLAALIAEVAEWTRQSAVSKGLGFQLEAPLPSPCWVRGDVARLRQVLMNLCGNALKFTDSGSVRLQLSRKPDGHTSIAVIDSGCGFPTEHAERLFEAFHQEDASNKRRHGGTGLGLAISRELARLMGGDLQALGHPGLGAQFTLTLPLADGAPPVPAAPAQPPILRGRVLVVEDNPINAMVAEAMLARAGLGVDTVTDGHQAVQRTLAERFDVVLMDCQMPVLDGIEATRQIREREASAGAAPLPIVGLTANATEEDRQACLAAGMDDYLAKPFREHQLHGVLARYLTAA